MSPCIMGLTTQDPYILKEHTNIKQDTAIQKFKNLLTNVWLPVTCPEMSGNPYISFANFGVFEWLYLVQY